MAGLSASPWQTPPRAAAGLFAAIGLAAVIAAMSVAGSAPSMLPQLVCLPIVAAGLGYGARGGLGAGVVVGLLSGPAPLLDAESGVVAAPASWLAWLAGTSAVGTVAGGLAAALGRQRLSGRPAARRKADALRHLTLQQRAASPATAAHSVRVARHAAVIARALGLGPREAERLRVAALLHDFGKLSLPAALLAKRGPLHPAEWATVKRHPLEAVRLLAGAVPDPAVMPAIRHHHERWDGSGYPDGLAGEAIPLGARILAVADAFDAMTEERPYRPAKSTRAALQQLRDGAGSQFDPRIVAAFLPRFVPLPGLTDTVLSPPTWQGLRPRGAETRGHRAQGTGIGTTEWIVPPAPAPAPAPGPGLTGAD